MDGAAFCSREESTTVVIGVSTCERCTTSETGGTGETRGFEVFGTSNPELLIAPFSPVPPVSLGYLVRGGMYAD